jgi:hypothetical protein
VLLIGSFSLYQSVHLFALDDQVQRVVTDANQQAEVIRDYQALHRTEAGLPYMYDLDSYYFLARAQGQRAENDNERPFFSALETAVYRTVIAFVPTLTPSDTLFFLPLALGLLTLVAFFFLARKITGNTAAAYVATLVLAVHHRFYTATAAGMGDNQSLNLLWSVLFFLAALCAADAWQNKHVRTAGIWSATAAVIFFLFTKTWGGAYYVLVVLGAALALCYGLQWAQERRWKKLGMLTATAALGVFLLTKTAFWGYALRRLFAYGSSAAIPRNIDELTGGDAGMFALALGGWAIVAIAALAWLLVAKGNISKPRLKSLLLLAWFALLASAAYCSIRFSVYALPPLAVLVGIASEGVAVGAQSFGGGTRVRQAAIRAATLAVLALLLVPNLIGAQHAHIPFMHDGIAQVGAAVDRAMPANARVIAWWDFGHLFRYATHREPFLDGRGDAPLAHYWLVGRALLSSNRAEAFNAWSALVCKEHARVAPYRAKMNLLEQPTPCTAPTEAAIVVEERMLAITDALVDVVREYEPSLTTGAVDATRVERCAPASPEGTLLDCGGLAVDLASMTAAGGLPVRLTINGTRTMTAAHGDRVAIVYQAGNNLDAFTAPTWLADTMLVRLLAGESFGMEKIAEANEPERIVAYRFHTD